MERRVHEWIQDLWYGGNPWYRLLLPLSGLYWLIVESRRALFRSGVFSAEDPGVAVIVIGNITVGGTGKTPLTIWLVEALKRRGFAPGIASRGYGGSGARHSMRVDPESDPGVVGDEPVLLARRTGCPVVVDPDRARAARMLAEDGADLVVTDDGLQHYRLARNYEICVVDARRWLGNRRMLPAGPLREPAGRLAGVDQVLVNGALPDDTAGVSAAEQNAMSFELVAREACRMNGSLTRPLGSFAGETVHAVAAIGNPRRFFDLLRRHGMQVIEHAYPDHATVPLREVEFADAFPVLMTEKDAVKLSRATADRFWYVPVDVEIDPLEAGPWLEQIEHRMRKLEEGR